MSKPIVLGVESVGKCYVEHQSELARVASWFGMPPRIKRKHWAVRDVSFNLHQGECLGLIGQNGAGKSTLLKLITGTVRPTTGQVATIGRTSAILELGLGFNPDMTGRQNVFQAGGLMGNSQAQLAALIPSIEDFSELGEFFDRPIRTYSSGMTARLAFSLATAIRPEVLIIDEVLAVGDAYFQHKSFGRIRQFREEGASILLVTHALGDVRALCDRILLLDKGSVVKDGLPDEVADYYTAMISAKESSRETIQQRRQKNGWSLSRSGTFEAVARSIELVDAETGDEVTTAKVGQVLKLKVSVDAQIDVPRMILGIMLRDRTGHVVFGTNTWHTKQVLEGVVAGENVNFEVTFPCSLGPGSYSITTAVANQAPDVNHKFEWIDNAVVFEVVNTDLPVFGGSNALGATIEMSRGT